MNIKISKEFHYNKVEVDFVVTPEYNEAEDAVAYLKWLLGAMDTEDMPGHAPDKQKPVRGQNRGPVGPATEKQINLIKRLYKDQIVCDFDKLTAADASTLINAFYNDHKDM